MCCLTLHACVNVIIRAMNQTNVVSKLARSFNDFFPFTLLRFLFSFSNETLGDGVCSINRRNSPLGKLRRVVGFILAIRIDRSSNTAGAKFFFLFALIFLNFSIGFVDFSLKFIRFLRSFWKCQRIADCITKVITLIQLVYINFNFYLPSERLEEKKVQETMKLGSVFDVAQISAECLRTAFSSSRWLNPAMSRNSSLGNSMSSLILRPSREVKQLLFLHRHNLHQRPPTSFPLPIFFLDNLLISPISFRIDAWVISTFYLVGRIRKWKFSPTDDCRLENSIGDFPYRTSTALSCIWWKPGHAPLVSERETI